LDHQALRVSHAITLQQARNPHGVGIECGIDVATVLVSGFQGLPSNQQLVCIHMIFNLELAPMDLSCLRLEDLRTKVAAFHDHAEDMLEG
jgi:hypothetical protein